MGNKIRIMSSIQDQQDFKEITAFKFHGAFAEDTNNGLYFNDIYIPEEIVSIILSYIEPKDILKTTLVCRKWCNIIKSTVFWIDLYTRTDPKKAHKAKKLPWYVYYSLLSTNYFNRNLIKNGNGEENFKYWVIARNYGDEFRIEDPPCGADPLPPDIPEFHGHTSCFATSYYECNKLQEISFKNNRLLQFIFAKYKPHIYVSEWVAGRFDCGCVYSLWCKLCGDTTVHPKCSTDQVFLSLIGKNVLYEKGVKFSVQQFQGSAWEKQEMLIQDYPAGVHTIIFQHEGKDTQFWKGHYGSKMAGGVVKILFDSIKEEP